MSEYPQPGLHPDPDTLNAFIEGVLPEHERLACLTHFAGCAACREVVYLAQGPEAPSPDPVVEKSSLVEESSEADSGLGGRSGSRYPGAFHCALPHGKTRAERPGNHGGEICPASRE